MTTKEAAETFRIEVKEVTKRKKDDMIIGTYKEKNRIVIPDTTTIIPSKAEIQNFLFQIIKYKNNNSVIISRELCPDEDSLKVVMDYLYRKGFIGKFNFDPDIQTLFKDIKLTDDGMSFVFKQQYKDDKKIFGKIQINPSINIASIVIG